MLHVFSDLTLLRWNSLELLHLEHSPLLMVAVFCLDLTIFGELLDDIALMPWLLVFPGTTDRVWRKFDKLVRDTSKVSNFSKTLFWSPAGKTLRINMIKNLSQSNKNLCLDQTPPVSIFFCALSRN